MDSPRTVRFNKLLIGIILINALLTGYLLKIAVDQQRRIQTLERNDLIIQSVDKLNTKVDTLKNRIQSLYH